MIKQTLAFSNPAYLSLKNSQMVIDTKSDKGIVTRPIEDIGLIVIESHSVTITSALLSALVDNNVAVMICDSKHLPNGMLVPFVGNTLFTERTHAHINASLPLKKQLWQQTIIAKIINQSSILKKYQDNETGCMDIWAKQVRSGDPENIEARAAIFYWHNLFKERSTFRRGDDDNPINALLNYGYAILRAIMARSLVGAGLMPQLGIFHHNRYNPYCLADDIMEPYRPFVDQVVLDIYKAFGENCSLTVGIKRQLLTIPVIDVTLNKLRRPLMIAAELTAASLAKCFTGESRKILYPQIHD